MPQRQPDTVDGNRRFAVEALVSQPRERGRSGKRGGVTEELTACRHGVECWFRVLTGRLKT